VRDKQAHNTKPAGMTRRALKLVLNGN